MPVGDIIICFIQFKFFRFFIAPWLFILLYFTALAKDIIENHFDNYSKHLCKGLQEQIYALTNQKEELTWQLSQRLTNSSEVPSTNSKAKLENSLKTAYQNLVSFKFATNSFAYICEYIHKLSAQKLDGYLIIYLVRSVC